MVVRGKSRVKSIKETGNLRMAGRATEPEEKAELVDVIITLWSCCFKYSCFSLWPTKLSLVVQVFVLFEDEIVLNIVAFIADHKLFGVALGTLLENDQKLLPNTRVPLILQAVSSFYIFCYYHFCVLNLAAVLLLFHDDLFFCFTVAFMLGKERAGYRRNPESFRIPVSH